MLTGATQVHRPDHVRASRSLAHPPPSAPLCSRGHRRARVHRYDSMPNSISEMGTEFVPTSASRYIFTVPTNRRFTVENMGSVMRGMHVEQFTGFTVGEQMQEDEWLEFELGPYGAHRYYPVGKSLLWRHKKQQPRSFQLTMEASTGLTDARNDSLQEEYDATRRRKLEFSDGGLTTAGSRRRELSQTGALTYRHREHTALLRVEGKPACTTDRYYDNCWVKIPRQHAVHVEDRGNARVALFHRRQLSNDLVLGTGRRFARRAGCIEALTFLDSDHREASERVERFL